MHLGGQKPGLRPDMGMTEPGAPPSHVWGVYSLVVVGGQSQQVMAGAWAQGHAGEGALGWVLAVARGWESVW